MEIRVLGNVEIHGDTGVLRLRRSGERCVLAVLALRAQAPVTVATLVDRLWSGTRQSDKSIDTVGSYLRRIRAGIKAVGGQSGWLRYDRSSRSCVLDIDPAWVDYHRFAAQAMIARRDRDPLAWQEALALWRGPALADVGGHWADQRRHALESERIAAYEDLLQHQLAAGRHAQVVRTVTDLIEDSTPTDRLLLLGAHGMAGSGQHTAIRDWVARVTLRMRNTVDAAPAADVLDEIDRLIANPVGAASPTALLSPPADPVPTAMFSLRADSPTFTGRADELRSLLHMVDAALDGQGRAIAIHAVDGMAGVGKTAFSVHAAYRLADRFPDGTLFLELHGHTPGQTPVPPGQALDSLLRAAGVDPSAIPPKLEDRARLWRDRTAGKRILLVLDDAADHDQVRPLLPGTAGNLVLITSRHRLPALEGAQPFTLDVLPPTQAVDLLVRLAGLDTDTDRRDEHAVADIVARCGYLPLAISLAGAQLRAHPRWTARYLVDLLATEHDRLEHLAAGDRSVTAAFTMSFRHLPVEQQRLFRLLGVHPGPEIDAYAAAALADSSLRETRRWLAALHTDHLIQETAPGRYQLHDLVRAYAHSLAAELDPDVQQHALHRVLTYYCYTAHTANAHLPAYHTATIPRITTAPAHVPGLDSDTAAQAWFTAELSTLTTCVQRAARGADEHLAVHLAATLQPFLRLNGYTERARHTHQTALAAAIAIGDHRGQATTLTNLGAMQYVWGEYEPAARGLTRALELFTALDDRLGQANARTILGVVQLQRGEYTTATGHFTRALELFTALDDRLGQANARNGLSGVRYRRGEYEAAADGLTHALELCTALDDRLGQANARTDLGRVRYQQGEYEAAAHHLTDALRLYGALAYRRGQANARIGLGRVRYQQGDFEAAARHLTHALELCTALDDRLGQANALIGLGAVRYRRKEFDAAADDLTHALELCTALDDRLGQANALTNLGRVRHERAEYEAAADDLTHALRLYTALGDSDGAAETLNNLGDLTLDYPDGGDPHAYFSQALTIARGIGTAVHEAHALAGQAQCLLRTADTDDAVVLLREAHTLNQTLGVPEAIRIEKMLSTLESTATNHRTKDGT